MNWKYAFAVLLIAAGSLPAPGPCFGADAAAPGAGTARGQDSRADFQTLDSMFSLYQPYLDNISAYQPVYFLAGADPEESKFQISLKYRLLTPEKHIAEKYPWSKNLYLAYTQTSFWDLGAASQPFKDTSYKPELFFRSDSLYSGGPATSRLFVQTGFRHESNGRDEDASRSTNFAYIRPIWILFDRETRLGMQIAPILWAYVNNDNDTNPDLDRYRGYFDLAIKAGHADGIVCESHMRWAAEGPSLKLDLTYPLSRLLPTDLDIYLQAQYVNALAESLLHYRQRTRALRLGIAFVR